MIIDCNNKAVINNLYIHDSYFQGFTYNYTDHSIVFECINPYLNKTFIFKFINVIFFSTQECDFWGGGDRILEWYSDDCQDILTHLFQEQKGIDNQYLELLEVKYRPYIQICFLINSGAQLTIICEKVDFIEKVISE